MGQILFGSNESEWEVVREGFAMKDMISWGFGLLQSHPSSTSVQIVIAKQTTLLFAFFIRPKIDRFDDLLSIVWNFF